MVVESHVLPTHVTPPRPYVTTANCFATPRWEQGKANGYQPTSPDAAVLFPQAAMPPCKARGAPGSDGRGGDAIRKWPSNRPESRQQSLDQAIACQPAPGRGPSRTQDCKSRRESRRKPCWLRP